MSDKPTITAAGAAALISLAFASVLGGCYPQEQAEPAVWGNPLDQLESTVVADPQDVNYVLTRMEYGRCAIMLGSYSRAKPKLMEAFKQLASQQENVAAAVGSERFKYYKGETYERAMMCCYLGLAEYLSGDYNNARIFFTRALSADRGAVVKKDTPEIYGDDFALAYYWLGKTYDKLGNESNSNIAFKKAAVVTPRKDGEKELAGDRKEAAKYAEWQAKGEQWAYQTFHNPQKKQLYIDDVANLAAVNAAVSSAPQSLSAAAVRSPVPRRPGGRDEFFTRDYQKQANVVLMLEVGRCPWKTLAGMHGERTEVVRSKIRPHSINVYVDGHLGGQAFEVLDLWDQAATQDRIGEKDAAQTTKAVLKEILSHAPYAGSLAGYWDVSGDVRHWGSLPGKVYIYAARLSPGPHTVRLEMYDVNGKALPRWTNTYYGLGAPAAGEAVMMLNPVFDGDNMLPADQRQKAIKAGASPGELSPDTPAGAMGYY